MLAMAPVALSAALLLCVAALAEEDPFDKITATTVSNKFSLGTSGLGFGGPPQLIEPLSPRRCWCGTNADCWEAHGNTTRHCACKDGYTGTPPKCKPGPELWNLCFEEDPCGPYSECEVINGTRTCPRCALYHEGSPPHCRVSDKCRDACGLNAECRVFATEPTCLCASGFVGIPPNCTAGSELLAMCEPYPCGPYADCHMENGTAQCKCSRGYVGTPPHCEPGVAMWRTCFKDKPCGQHSKCDMVDGSTVCSPCDEGYSGDPPYCWRM